MHSRGPLGSSLMGSRLGHPTSRCRLIWDLCTSPALIGEIIVLALGVPWVPGVGYLYPLLLASVDGISSDRTCGPLQPSSATRATNRVDYTKNLGKLYLLSMSCCSVLVGACFSLGLWRPVPLYISTCVAPYVCLTYRERNRCPASARRCASHAVLLFIQTA